METAVRVPASSRINWRMILFGAVILLLVGYPVYIFLDEVATGGIHDHGQYVEIDLKAMSNFEMDQQTATASDIPIQWRKLDGKRVILRGEMWQPSDAGGKVGGFQLCYSIAKCCFSGPPKVQHFVDSKVIKGKRVYYYPNLVEVVGTLHVNVVRDGERVKSIYQLDVESVEPVT